MILILFTIIQLADTRNTLLALLAFTLSRKMINLGNVTAQYYSAANGLFTALLRWLPHKNALFLWNKNSLSLSICTVDSHGYTQHHVA